MMALVIMQPDFHGWYMWFNLNIMEVPGKIYLTARVISVLMNILNAVYLFKACYCTDTTVIFQTLYINVTDFLLGIRSSIRWEFKDFNSLKESPTNEQAPSMKVTSWSAFKSCSRIPISVLEKNEIVLKDIKLSTWGVTLLSFITFMIPTVSGCITLHFWGQR
jgi:hypothetical protein